MAEGIKISEMEQVTTLEDGCCFPVVSNGENKKITKKDLLADLVQTNEGERIYRYGFKLSIAEDFTKIGSTPTYYYYDITSKLPDGAIVLNQSTNSNFNLMYGKVPNSTVTKDVFYTVDYKGTCYGYVEYML